MALTKSLGGSGGGGGVSSFNGRTGAVVPASGDYAVADVTGAAPLASPALTGTPTAPTASAGDNSTTVATTAYVDSAVGAVSGGGTWATLIKSADQTRNSTTTLAADSELQFACASGTTYLVRGFVHYAIANGTMDYKYALNFSGTTSLVRVFISHSDPGKTASSSFRFENYATSFVTGTPLGTAASDGSVLFEATFTTTSTGTFSFQWAQNTSDAGNATVRAGSYLEYASL